LPAQSTARVYVNIDVNIPAYTFPAPYPLSGDIRYYDYIVPDADADIIFYHDYWYCPYGSRCLKSRGYNGLWIHMGFSRIPSILRELPPDYRLVPLEYKRIPQREFNSNWRRWAREKY